LLINFDYLGGKMKRIAFLTVCAVMMFAVVSGCSKKEEARKNFVLGLDDSFPPMGFRDEKNNIIGYDIDLAKEVCERLALELVTQPINWDAKEQELNTGKIDCIWNGFSITEERKQAILYSPPYLRNAQVVVVNGSSPVQKLSDLAGKSVGTQQGSSSIDAIDARPDFKNSLKDGKPVEFQDFLAALMDLETGRLDAVVIDVVVAGYNIQKSGKDFRTLTETLGDEEFGIGFRKTDAELQQKIWNTLLEMAKDGTVAEITTKWFGSDISVIGK
jgi:polar amino acid transport system substrate-binding protein